MGLLDLFDGATYAPGATQRDMLDRVLAGFDAAPPSQVDANPALNANASMPAAAPAAPQPQNASPLAIGNYQMPRIGQQSDFELPPGQLDPHTGEHVVQPAQPAAMATPAPSPDLGSHLMTGYENMRHGGGLIGSIVAAATGRRNDPQAEMQSLQQAQLQRQAEAFRSLGYSPAEANLAAINSEYAKAIIAQKIGQGTHAQEIDKDGNVWDVNRTTGQRTIALASKDDKFTNVTVKGADGSETAIPFNTKAGTYGAPKFVTEPSQTGGTVMGPNGQMIAIPPGVDRKTFVNEISKTNADAATGKQTETQAKASTYAARMESAEAALKSLAGQGTSYIGNALSSIPFIGGTAATNSVTPEKYQRYTQARDNFIAALLRQESGAAIGKSEYEAADKQYFPQPGDSNAVIQQKAATRKIAIEQMKRAAGPGYQSPSTGNASSADPLGIR